METKLGVLRSLVNRKLNGIRDRLALDTPDKAFHEGRQEAYKKVWQYIDRATINERTLRCGCEVTSRAIPKEEQAHEDSCEEHGIEYCDLHGAAEGMLAALKEISKSEGRFARDKFQRAINTIEGMVAIAEAAIAKVEGE